MKDYTTQEVDHIFDTFLAVKQADDTIMMVMMIEVASHTANFNLFPQE